MRQVHGHAVGVVGHVRSSSCSPVPARREHEVLHQELAGGPSNKSASVCRPSGPSKTYVLVDAHPGQSLAQPRDVVAAPRQVLLGGEQIAAVLPATSSRVAVTCVVIVPLPSWPGACRR